MADFFCTLLQWNDILQFYSRYLRLRKSGEQKKSDAPMYLAWLMSRVREIPVASGVPLRLDTAGERGRRVNARVSQKPEAAALTGELE